MLLPGATMPEFATEPTRPLPSRRPAAPTLTAPPRLPCTASVPPAIDVLPPKPLLPAVTSRVPAPALVNDPVPEKRPSYVNMLSVAVAIVPAPATIMSRALVIAALVSSTPPSSVTAPSAAPRLPSLAMRSVPPTIRVPPV